MKQHQRKLEIKRIIAPTDFSHCATAALEYLEMLARQFKSEITLLHAVVLRAPVELMQYPGLALADAVAAQENAARTALDQYQSIHAAGFPSLSTFLATGDPASIILTESRSRKADLIVIGTHGRSGVRRALLGSVAEQVIRESDRPVLTVRCTAEHQEPKVRRVLCPVNYTAVAGKAFLRAVQFASAFDARLIVLHLLEKHDADDDKADLERLRVWVGDLAPAVSAEVLVRRGQAARQVNRYAREHDVDLIVLGARPKRRGKRSVFGSTTNEVTRHAPCPVLTVPVAQDSGE
jgi:nucleotide-binding universal stress UspA family protein